jgi:uncharacterized protein
MAVLIFKPIERCNSNCLYCDTITKQQESTMDLGLLEVLFTRINEFLDSNPHENLVFTWHGGEVCLLGAEYLAHARRIQDEICPSTKQRIHHHIQSNLTLLNQDLIDGFNELGITSFGTSYDPVPHIRGMGKNRDSDKYNREFYRATRLLAQNGIKWGVIYTVHGKALGRAKELFYYLTNMNMENPPQFNMVRSFQDHRKAYSVTGEQFADFLGEIFAIYWPNRERYGAVQPFTWYIDAVINRNTTLVCEMSGQCAYHWLYIGPEGEAAHCGISGDYKVFDYGSIRDRSFSEILADKNRDLIALRSKEMPQTHCKDCRFWGICHGGCPAGAYIEYRDLGLPAPSCTVTKIFLERYFEPITGQVVDFSFKK